MYNYTTHCTPEQTKKALELGAPINVRCSYNGYHPLPFNKEIIIEPHHFAEVPTAEQMIGWLRAQGFQFKFAEFDDKCLWQYRIGDWFKAGGCSNPKEATLAAIDAALEYLTNNKK